MTAIFVDTSFYIALCYPRDEKRSKAVELTTVVQGESVTTEYVLIETGNWFCKASDRQVFVDLISDLQCDPQTTILEGGHDWFTAGLARYKQRHDKDWSLTDCISFVVMETLGLTTALTADHHFEQAGFKILL